MISAVARERLKWGPSATAVNLFRLATQGGIALLTWFHIDPLRGGSYLGAISLVQQARPDAKRAMAELKALAIRTHLLSGESRIETEPIARELMVDDFEPDLGPAQKLQRVRDLTTTRHVAVLGDAFEDASALDAATVRIAIGSTAAGTDVRADVILLGTDIAPLAAVLPLARRTHRVILANITGSLLIAVAGIALAAAGILSPLVAVLVRTGAELAFILNSSRLAADERMARSWPSGTAAARRSLRAVCARSLSAKCSRR
jgi:P-type Cu+ transporter